MPGESALKSKPKDWQSSKNIRKRAGYLLKDPDNKIPGDVTFLIGDGSSEEQKTFKCHKFILAMVSSMFQAMFYGLFPQTEGIVKIPDVTPNAFHHLLQYAYGQSHIELDVKCLNDALDTLYCAKKYLIEKLERFCRDHIQLHVTVFGKDACLVFQRAPQMDEEGLASLALARIALRASHIMESDAFLRLSFDCLKKIVDYVHLNAKEPEIYHGIRRWVKHNIGPATGNAFREALGTLLYSIRFPLFSATELTNGPVTDGVLTGDEARHILQHGIMSTFKPELPYLTTPRTPLPAPLSCYFQVVYAAPTKPRRRLFLLYARPDLAPQCCSLLRHILRFGKHIRIASYDNQDTDRTDQCQLAFLPAERNALAHSLTGACWWEWDVEGNTGHNVRIGVGSKPHVHHSAVFGFVLSLSDNEWVPFSAWDDRRIQGVAGFHMARRNWMPVDMPTAFN